MIKDKEKINILKLFNEQSCRMYQMCYAIKTRNTVYFKARNFDSKSYLVHSGAFTRLRKEKHCGSS